MTGAKVKRTDRITIESPVPADGPTTIDFVNACAQAGASGYALKSAGEITGGSQRDPYVVGVRLVFEKL